MIPPNIIIYRIGNFFYRNNIYIIPKFLTLLNRFLFSVWIPSSIKIGKNFKMGYWGLGTVLHSHIVIGQNCHINQNVTVGRNFGDKKVPIIGDNVYIGAGSVIFGEITIGDNVIIGSNSVINKSIPENHIVAGNPFRILNSNSKNKYWEIDGNI
ncbi:MAG: serine O-acetyltransferase [Flavobacteriaceae bacterium]|jgi:serine O-acetyltransferase